MTSTEDPLTQMRAGGAAPPESAGPLLRRYVELLLAHGRRLSLLSSGNLTEERIAVHLRDITDGLLLAGPGTGAQVLDYGAGGGLVGFPWAALRPDLGVTLLESKPRKALFLRETASELSLPNVRIWEGDGRGYARSFPGSFDLVVTRGVATDRKTLAALHRFLKPGAALLLFKGPESAGAAKECAGQGGFHLDREKISLLGGGKRRVFLLLRRGA